LPKVTLRFKPNTLNTGWGVPEMKLAPPRSDGRSMICTADEIQLQESKDLRTRVVSWTIGSK
jgi:hypothetical protein